MFEMKSIKIELKSLLKIFFDYFNFNCFYDNVDDKN